MHHPDCVYCDIALGRSPAHIVLETRAHLVFADPAPIRPGHLVLLPKAHHSCFEDLPPALAGGLMRQGQRLARLLKAEYDVARVGFVITGFEAPHAHAHLVPLVEPGDITSRRYIPLKEVPFAAPARAESAELAALSTRLRHGLACESF